MGLEQREQRGQTVKLRNEVREATEDHTRQDEVGIFF